MKRYYNILLLVGLSAVLWSCHTTEANYKASYDLAVEASRSGERGEQYRQDIERRSKNTHLVDGDSIRLVFHMFNIVEDDNSKIMKYNVVVAEFVQKFNAMSYRDRLRKQGLDAFVVYISKREIYCVVARATNDLSVAAVFSNNPDKYMKLNPNVPRVWVLEHR